MQQIQQVIYYRTDALPIPENDCWETTQRAQLPLKEIERSFESFPKKIRAHRCEVGEKRVIFSGIRKTHYSKKRGRESFLSAKFLQWKRGQTALSLLSNMYQFKYCYFVRSYQLDG